MQGSLSHELEVGVPASVVWDLYKGLGIGKLVSELAPHVIEKVEVVEGDGGLGTVLKLTFPAGTPMLTFYKEKFTIVDHEKRIKETEVIEGGFLDLGFSLYRVTFEIIEKDTDSSIIKSIVEYQVKQEFASNASVVSIGPVGAVSEMAAKYLLEKKSSASN
ncbi:hypothetical protein GIB67_033215 [Kingdonia uniflora]|uniref:Bet v I/Major latex protein domain-containing protein n=1 Tax=Kingdonia uniflora TaxID=39325 RepID=A0A7J7MPD0_9MAGN|nr:hypothetical protein GIB67_033215 [Kingdonia uniflora]